MTDVLEDNEKEVMYKIECVYDKTHIFDKIFKIKKGSEEKMVSPNEVYCPYCNKLVTVEVKGEVVPDKNCLRTFAEARGENDGKSKIEK
ncbi:MAG: hypothetical protein GY765_24190 [bacterium]|nr:hypothetical protein [bacterium]